jgi:hypothetical protein
MREEDKYVGMIVFGWTEEETEQNDWLDEFFNVWRPRPTKGADLYPAWTSSPKYAADLIAHLATHGHHVTISQSDVGLISFIAVDKTHLVYHGLGETLPAAIGNAFTNAVKLKTLFSPEFQRILHE